MAYVGAPQLLSHNQTARLFFSTILYLLTVKQKRPPIISDHKCPECEKGLIRRKGKKKFKGKVSYFWGCSGFPECEVTLFDKAGKPNFDSVRKPETTSNGA